MRNFVNDIKKKKQHTHTRKSGCSQKSDTEIRKGQKNLKKLKRRFAFFCQRLVACQKAFRLEVTLVLRSKALSEKPCGPDLVFLQS